MMLPTEEYHDGPPLWASRASLPHSVHRPLVGLWRPRPPFFERRQPQHPRRRHPPTTRTGTTADRHASSTSRGGARDAPPGVCAATWTPESGHAAVAVASTAAAHIACGGGAAAEATRRGGGLGGGAAGRWPGRRRGELGGASAGDHHHRHRQARRGCGVGGSTYSVTPLAPTAPAEYVNPPTAPADIEAGATRGATGGGDRRWRHPRWGGGAERHVTRARRALLEHGSIRSPNRPVFVRRSGTLSRDRRQRAGQWLVGRGVRRRWRRPDAWARRLTRAAERESAVHGQRQRCVPGGSGKRCPAGVGWARRVAPEGSGEFGAMSAARCRAEARQALWRSPRRPCRWSRRQPRGRTQAGDPSSAGIRSEGQDGGSLLR